MRKRSPGLVVMFLLLVGVAFLCGAQFSASPSQARGDEEKVAPAPVSTCPKCQGPMESGVLLDYFEAGAGGAAEWAPFVQGQLPFSRRPKTKKITANRCTSCGYLEFFAK